MPRPTKEHSKRLRYLISQGLKSCSKCKQIKPLSEFVKQAGRVGGVASQCKECDRKRHKKYHDAHIDEIKANGRAYYQTHKEQSFAHTRRYRLNPEFRARERVYHKRYRESEHGKQMRETYARSDARKESSKRYAKKHPEQKQAVWHVWNARRKGVIVKPKNCEKCSKETDKLHAHHYLGYTKEHRLDVQWLCVNCHESMHHNFPRG